MTTTVEPEAALPPCKRKPRLPAGKGRPYREGLKRAKAEGWEAWIRSYSDRLAVADGCWFDIELAQIYSDWIEGFCKHYKDPWRGWSFHLLPWQRDNVVWPLFGWRRADGSRRFRRMFLFIPKKNGKTTLGAAIELALLVVDQEGGAELYTAATTRPQARISWKDCQKMVQHSPELKEILTTHNHISTINYEDLDASLVALSADSAASEGYNIHGLLIDELHAWTDRSFWDTLYYGGAARREPMFLVTTTAGDDVTSLGYEEYETACAIRDGVSPDWSYLPVIYEATPEDDWTDPEVWRKANPSIGVTFREEEIKAACAEAQRKPSMKPVFLRYRLNRWGERLHGWIPIDKWDACGMDGLTLERMR